MDKAAERASLDVQRPRRDGRRKADVSLCVQSRRCIIPASGFYEWTGERGAKTPHYFSSPSGAPLAFAGLWETWRDPESDAQVDSATINVGSANEWMSRFHNRMPVILDWRDAGAWMASDSGSLLRAPPEHSLQEWIVSPRVNRSGAGDDNRALIEPERLGASESA